MTRPCLGDGSRAGSWGPPLPRHLARVTFRGRHLRKQRIEKRCETRFPTPSNSIPEDPLKAQTGANSKSSSAAAATPFRSVQQLLAESSLAARPTPKSPAANRRQVVSRRDTRSHPFAAHLQRQPWRNFARPILVSGYGDFVRGFKSSRPDLQRRKCLIQNALRNTEPLATNQRPFFRSTALSDCHKTIYGSLNHIVHMRWGLSIRPRMQRICSPEFMATGRGRDWRRSMTTDAS